MCDPATIIGIVSAIGGAASAAASVPDVPLPDAVAPEALEDVGADVLLGGSDTSEQDEDATKTSKAATAVTGVSGLNTVGSGSGISIL